MRGPHPSKVGRNDSAELRSSLVSAWLLRLPKGLILVGRLSIVFLRSETVLGGRFMYGGRPFEFHAGR